MRLVPALASLLLVPALACAADTPVPVAKVVLYSSGVGYIEHQGSVEGDATAQLRFTAPQLNDVLKSLLLQDLDQGRVASVEYPAQAPLERTLKSFQVDITGNPSLAALLTQLRGAKVAVQVQGERLAGAILGCETRQKPAGQGSPIASPVLTLVTADGLRQIELEQVAGLRLEDAALQQELDRALAALAAARDQDKKPVLVRFQGQGKRRVRIGYVVETPVWKTSYRLVMPEAGAAKGLVQGWAIVENQTESDWNAIDLSLVSGRPISFIQDLYRPLYASRPVVEPPLPPGVKPVAYDGGRAEGGLVGNAVRRADKRRGEMPAAPAPAMRMQAAGAAMDAMVAESAAPIDIAASVAPVAAAAEQVGELFQYQVPHVDLPRSRSAMLPILGDQLAIERVSIYDPEVQARHPLNGAWIENTSGKHLLGGPVTVLDGGAYAGDARLDDLAPKARRLVSYALDVPVTVDAGSADQTRTVTSGTLVKGSLRLTTRLAANRTYVIDNGAERERTLVVAHRITPGFDLEKGQAEPAERTPTHYRFRLVVKAGGQARLAVSEVRIMGEYLGVADLDRDAIQVYAANGALPQKVRDALQKAAGLKAAVIDLDRQMAERQEQIQAIVQEQNRLRENMRTVNQSSQYSQRLLQKLNEQETKVETLQGESEKLRAQRAQRRGELEAFLAGASAE